MASLRKRANGTVSVLWRDPRTRKQTSMTFNTEREAERLRRLLDANGQSLTVALEAQHQFVSVAPTVAAVIEEHVSTIAAADPRTRGDYRGLARRHINPHIGHIPVDHLTRRDVRAWIMTLAETELSDKTIANHHGLLSAALATAVENGHIKANPCKGIRLPRRMEHSRTEIVFLTPEQWKTLLPCIHPHYQPMFTMLAGTGMRWGEACALTVGDVHLGKNPSVRIHKARRRDENSRAYTGPTKTRRSNRTVSLPRDVVTAIRPLLDRDPDAALFTAVQGGPVQNYTIHARIWSPALAKANLGVRPRIHDLRHSHVAWLIAAGVDILTVQRRLGHESINTTLNTYGHVMDSQQSAAARAFDDLMG